MAERTRKPVALAMASSLRRFSCSALNCASFVPCAVRLLRMMDGASGIRADLVHRANLAAFGDDGIGGELAHLELRALGLVVGLRLVVADRGVLVARQYRAAFLLRPVGRADLHKLGFGGNGLCHVRREFGLIAAGIGATVALLSKVVAEQQFVVSGALGAVGATARRGNKLRIALVKGRVFQDKQHVRFNPELQVADGQENPRRFCPVVVYLFEASRKRLLLLVGGQLRQQERMAHADFVGVEGIDRCGHKVNQFQARSDERRAICPHVRRSARCCTSVPPMPKAARTPRPLPSGEFRRESGSRRVALRGLRHRTYARCAPARFQASAICAAR